MPNDVIALHLEGDISITAYVTAVSRLDALIKALQKEVAEDDEIDWIISRLEAGSALTEARGVPKSSKSLPGVERTAHAYLTTGNAIAERLPIPYSGIVQQAAQSLVSVLNHDIHVMRWENAEDDITLEQVEAAALPVKRPTEGAYGAVEGRVQTLSSRGSLRFTLYDLLHDRAVSCYVSQESEEIMKDIWGRLAIVEGWVKRDAKTGLPLTVRRVERISILSEYPKGTYRAAGGAVKRLPDQLRGEEIIRQMRDAG